MKLKLELEVKIPETCRTCRFDYDGYECVICNDESGNEKHHECNSYEETEKWCPLKEVLHVS